MRCIPTRPADIPRYTVPGTVPVTGGEPDWRRNGPTGKTTTADALRNPSPDGGDGVAAIRTDVPRSRRPRCRGDTLYQTFCAVCHGQTRATATGWWARKLGAPSLLTDRARGYTDGYLYSIIRYGRGVMPRYGDKVYLPADRWAIVNYVRKLQAQSAPAARPQGPRRSTGAERDRLDGDAR